MNAAEEKFIKENLEDKGYLAMAEYARKYGTQETVPPYYWQGPSCFPSVERLLRRCLDEGRTWQEVCPVAEGDLY